MPLVALLNDTEYIAALAHQVDHVLSQAAAQGGWLGPLFEESRPLLTARGALDFWQVPTPSTTSLDLVTFPIKKICPGAGTPRSAGWPV